MGLDNFPLLELPIDTALAGDNVLVPGISGKVIRIFRLFIVCDAAVIVTFKDGAATALTGAMSMTANGSIVFDETDAHWFATSVSNDFIANLSAPVGIRGRIYFTQFSL
jgi:hypothetical protein